MKCGMSLKAQIKEEKMDELITTVNTYSNNLIATMVPLNFDKQIYLIRAFEEDLASQKKYIRNAAVLVENELLTSTFTDTVHFFEELNLFDLGNDQNKYVSVVTHNNAKNLKLEIEDANIYLSKSEAKAMYKLYNLAFTGYSLSRVLEFEHRITKDNIAQFLLANNQIARLK